MTVYHPPTGRLIPYLWLEYTAISNAKYEAYTLIENLPVVLRSSFGYS